jgi:two-component system, NtrC family, sensor histidine kinase HydH
MIRRMAERPFNLSRWFAAVGLLSIATLSLGAGSLLTRFLTDRMLRQEGVLTMEFIHSVVLVENAVSYFRDPHANGPELESAFNHVASMPDVLRASAHNAERTVIWSNDHAIVGRQFLDNPELEQALAGELVVHGDRLIGHGGKAEHATLDEHVGYFVEIYFPVRDATGQVVGAVELYKTPRALFAAIQTAERAAWLGALAGGLFLYLTLFWLIRRADRLIRAQQERLVESETLAAVGEVGSAVAHGIRNPLAAIRSSAELAQETDDPAGKEAARDIIAEVDRMERWVRELLGYSRPIAGMDTAIDLTAVIAESLHSFAREEARGVRTVTDLPTGLPAVRGDPLLIGQVLGSLLANAYEAVRAGGQVSVSTRQTGSNVLVQITDDGPGMSEQQLARVFRPFYTTKPKGLGAGLPLAKRIIERFGGTIAVSSAPGRGTTVDVRLPAASRG